MRFCVISKIHNQGRDKCYHQPKPKGESGNTQRDLDYLDIMKNLIHDFFWYYTLLQRT